MVENIDHHCKPVISQGDLRRHSLDNCIIDDDIR
jgi:hypothetical protein